MKRVIKERDIDLNDINDRPNKILELMNEVDLLNDDLLNNKIEKNIKLGVKKEKE